MKQIQKALAELRRAIIISKLFNTLIDVLIVFLGTYLIFYITNITWYYSLAITLIYMIIFSRKKFKSIKYTEVERKVPILREKLRTAADNINKNNTIVRQLHKEVMKEMKYIKISMFLQPLKNTLKMLLIGIFAFGIILTASLSVQLFDFNIAIKNIGSKIGGSTDLFIPNVNITFKDNTEEIYEEENILEYGSEEIELSFNTAEGNLDFNRQKEAESLNFKGQYPTQEDLKAVSDSAYIEKKLAKDEEEIVKRYFNQITK